MELSDVLAFVEGLGAEPAGSRCMAKRFEEQLSYELFMKEFEHPGGAEWYKEQNYPYALELLERFRFFDGFTDYDYSVQADHDTEKELLKFGFTKKTLNVHYKDDLSESVYSLKVPYVHRGNHMYYLIEVVTKNNFSLYKRTWEEIRPEFYAQYLWKRSGLYKGIGKYQRYKRISGMFNQLFAIADIEERMSPFV